ncbi:NYN domain-containing protein [Campylobacter fetus]|uniref:NYN domain-containing protein n=1 Tax=Campylobacter fetus TaxID=196 RepID=UPI000FCBBF0D|nr:NYN domain-containing protein [Campylobacter fetus]RUT51005.1 NYN domain-containing protein [Campylobacter fetus]RUT51733.1 NYN domain-containing protein [Campylobacter fetus]
MQSNSTAIFVDFENLRQGVFNKAYKKKKWYFDYNNNPQKIIDFCNLSVFDSYTDLKDLYRIFFYTAKPLEDHISYETINNFIRSLETLNHTAIRLGKLVKRGEVITQKQVDMLLGIDMAEISIKKFVSKVVLIGYDSDMSPALKLARTNGIQTEIIVFEDLTPNIEPSLSKHCDIIKSVKVESIYRELSILNRK